MKIMILHLSDIHIGSTDWIIASSNKICKAVEDIAADCEYTFVAISGDLAATGSPGEYVKVLSLLENIVKDFKNPPISKEIVIITVPGNHDCNFTKVDSERSELLEKIKSIPSEDIDINTVNQCASVQADYFDFATRIGNKWDKQKLGYVMTIKLANYQLTFNCYNTAWMFIRDQLPASCIFPVNSANRHINSTISNLNISLLHHPLEWFNPDNRRIFKEYLTRISDLVLTGHEHQMGKRIEDNLEGKITLYIEGGELQDQKDIDNSGFISLVVETSTSTYRIMQYKWNGSVFKLVQENKWAPNGGRTLGRKSMNSYSISSLFQECLNSLDAPIFHPNKSGVLKLDDVYIFPNLRDLEEKESNIETKRGYFDSSQFATQISDIQKVFILGEAKSGKTTLCKSLYQKYHICGYVPVYINANEIQHSSLEAFDKLLSLSFKKQYNLIETNDFADVASNKQVLFIDDFEKATLPSEDLASLLDKINAKYAKVFIFANSIFELEDLIAKNSRLFLALNDYRMFSILQFGFELRHKLIQKWNRIGINRYEEEELVRKDDEYEQKMNILLGDGSIVASYPIFLLTMLLAIETGNTQNLETSSYSHYYQFIISQALVVLHLSNADLDSYYSFLTNLAKHLFLSRSRIISKQDFADFHSKFVPYYRVSPHSGMVYQFDKLKDNLCNANILEEYKGSFSFKQGFVYYFFVGKYLSENRTSEQEKETILNLIKDLQYEEYANILMFVIHHTKEDYILRAMIDHAKSIFAHSKPLKLESDTSYIGDLLEEVPIAVLKKIEIQEYRIEKSRQKDSAEPPKDKTPALRDKEIPPKREDDPTAIGFVTNLVIASRLIGLMGQILLDYRSIPGDTQEEIAEEVYLLSLRSLSGIFELLEKQNDKIIDNITKRIIADGIYDESKIKRQAKIILFNIYHVLAYSLIKIVSDSVGSDTLSAVVVDIPRKYPYLSIALIDISAKLDHYRGFPQGELVNFMRTISIPRNPIHSSFIEGRVKSGPQVQKSRILPFTLLRQLVEEYLYKFPTKYKERQRISSIVGIKIQEQLMIGQTSEERTEKQNE